MSSDLIVKLLFPVAEPAQMELQMTLAIATLTELLFYFSLPTNFSLLVTVFFWPYNRW